MKLRRSFSSEKNIIIIKEASLFKRIVLIGGFGLSFLTAQSSIGSDSSPHPPLPDRPAGGQEQTALTGLKADLKIILQDRFGRLSSLEHHFYKAGRLVRIEPPPSSPVDPNLPDGQRPTGPSEDIYIYDYTKRKQYRLIPSSNIYFETGIPPAGLIEAQREGWISLEESSNVETKKLKLAETTFDGHPCLLYLKVRSLMAAEGPKQKRKRLAVEYSLLWEAADLENLPVRIVYTGPDFITKIIEYRNARIERMDAALFQPPKGFLGLSPF